MIKTEVKISKDEVHKLIRDHMMNVHKLDVSTFKEVKDDWDKFNGFELTIKQIETSVDEIHESTPHFEAEEKKVMI